MNAASVSPTIARRNKKEFDSRSVKSEQLPDVTMPADGVFVRPNPDIVKLNGIEVTPEYADQIRFMEGPIKVIFHESGAQFAPPYVDCFNGGEGIGMFIDGKYIKNIGQVPVNEEVIIKRKHLEILARARETVIRTNVVTKPNEDPINNVSRSTMQKYPFSVLDHMEDHARSVQWLKDILSGK